MKQLIRYRKRTALRIFITMFLILTISSALFFDKQIVQAVRAIQYNNTPLAEDIYDFDEKITSVGISKVKVSFLDDTGLTYGGSSVDYSYAYTLIDGYYAVIMQEGAENGMRLFDLPDGEYETLILSELPANPHNEAITRLAADFAEYFEVSEEEVINSFYPNVLRLEGFRPNLILPLTYMIGGLVVTVLLYLFLNYKALNDITKNLNSTEMDQIDYESQSPLFKSKSLVLTKNYLIRTSGVRLDNQLFKNDSIVWIYRKTTTNRVYGIPAGKTHALVFYTKDSKKVREIPIVDGDFERFADVFEQLNPDVAIGYHDLYISLWKSSSDGETFFNKVNSLREQRESETKRNDVIDVTDEVVETDVVETESTEEVTDLDDDSSKEA